VKYIGQNVDGNSTPDIQSNQWREQYDRWMCEFESIAGRLPKLFLKAFAKHHFHDNIIESIEVRKVARGAGHKYNLTICMEDYHDNSVRHHLVFQDIPGFAANISFAGGGCCDWQHCEILPINERRMSFELMAFSEGTLYFEFSKLKYKRERIL